MLYLTNRLSLDQIPVTYESNTIVRCLNIGFVEEIQKLSEGYQCIIDDEDDAYWIGRICGINLGEIVPPPSEFKKGDIIIANLVKRSAGKVSHILTVEVVIE